MKGHCERNDTSIWVRQTPYRVVVSLRWAMKDLGERNHNVVRKVLAKHLDELHVLCHERFESQSKAAPYSMAVGTQHDPFLRRHSCVVCSCMSCGNIKPPPAPVRPPPFASP